MSVTILENQPVSFNTNLNQLDDNCNCRGQNFCQLVQRDDITSFQFKIDNCGSNVVSNGGFNSETGWNILGAEVVLNGGFGSGANWTTGAGWSIAAGKACKTPGSIGQLDQTVSPLTNSISYRIVYTVSNYVAGLITVFAGSLLGTSRSANGTYTEDLVANGTAFGLIGGNTFDGCIDNVSAKALGWTISGGKATHTTGNVTDLSQSSILLATGYYKIIFTVSGMTAGTLTPKAGTVAGDVISENGTYTVYITSDGNDLKFTPSTGFNGAIDNVSAYELQTNYEYIIADTNGIEIREINVLTQTIVEDHVLVEFPWDYQDVSKGCYRICFKSGNRYQCGVQDFGATATNGSASASCSDGVSNIAISVNDNTGLVVLTNQILTLGAQYRITFTLAFNAINNNVKVRPEAGTALGTYIDGTTLSANGTHTQIITCAGDKYLRFRFEGTHAVNSGTVTITNIIIEGCYFDNICSDCFSYDTTHECSQLLTWYNIEDNFGFIYSTGYEHKMRVKGKLWKPKHTKDKEIFRYSDGSRKTLFADSDKVMQLTLAQIPEYMHDALSSGLDHDYFIVGGDHYTAEVEDYEPQWRNSSLTAPVTIELIKNFQPVQRNNNC